MMQWRSSLFAIILLLFAGGHGQAQERLDPLRVNPALKHRVPPSQAERRMALSLPFFDDFYPSSVYPDSNLWEDALVYVNATFPVGPPTIGVATFDGLNATGQPYSIFSDDYGVADMLTSRAIDLSGLDASDDVYLSFYYQPAGLGDAPDFEESDPENRDYLMLEFRDTAGVWDSIWVVTGDTLRPFEQVFIAVDTPHLHADFQFRFKAMGRLTGAFDHWHVDYVRLDRNRDAVIEQNIPEMAYQYWPTPLISPYYAMPYLHFDSTYIADSHSVFIRNNFIQATTDLIDFYTARELSGGTVIDNFAGSSRDVGPLLDIEERYAGVPIPQDLTGDTVTIRVTYRFLVSAEDTSITVSNRNNTVVRDQVFNNFFSYDDGTAERAYILDVRRNDGFFGQAAVRYEATVQDTLRAVRFQFIPFNEDLTNVNFALLVWKSLASDTTNEEVLYREDFISVGSLLSGDSLQNLNDYLYVPIRKEYIEDGSDELLVEGEFYVGYEVAMNVELPIGFDLNTDGSSRHYIQLGQGWSPTQFQGSLIMNPVMGKALSDDYVVSATIEQLQSLDFGVYPNPVRTFLNIDSEVANAQIEVFDMPGRKMTEQKLFFNGSIDVSGWSSGIYILRITDTATGQTGSRSFIKP